MLKQLCVGLVAAGIIVSSPVRAESEILIGAIYSMTGSGAEVGIDAKAALETAADVINGTVPLPPLPLAGAGGLPHLGGAKIKLIFEDHQSDPQKGRAAAERLITEQHVVALIGTYQSSVGATVSQTADRYGIPFFSAENSSPTLQKRGLKWFFRAAADDVMFTKAMFDFLADMQKATGQATTAVSLIHEDTLFGTDSSNAQKKFAEEAGIKVAADIKYRANSPSLTSEVTQLKTANAPVLMPSSYTTDSILMMKTMKELGWRPKAIIAQAAGFQEAGFLNAIGADANGIISRSAFALDMAAKRPVIGKVNELFKAKTNKNLNDGTAREFTALMILADAIDRAGSTDPEKMRAALMATDLPGESTIMPWARVHFDAEGQNPDATPALVQYRDGLWHTIWPAAVASTAPVWDLK